MTERSPLEVPEAMKRPAPFLMVYQRWGGDRFSVVPAKMVQGARSGSLRFEPLADAEKTDRSYSLSPLMQKVMTSLHEALQAPGGGPASHYGTVLFFAGETTGRIQKIRVASPDSTGRPDTAVSYQREPTDGFDGSLKEIESVLERTFQDGERIAEEVAQRRAQELVEKTSRGEIGEVLRDVNASAIVARAIKMAGRSEVWFFFPKGNREAAIAVLPMLRSSDPSARIVSFI